MVVTRKVKMSAIFDQVDDTEITPWTPARIMRAFMAAFKATNDDEWKSWRWRI